MGSGRAAAPAMRKINSETNLAVQLLLAVSDGRIGKHHPMPCRTTSQSHTPPSASSSDIRTETSDDSEATDAAAPSLASPAFTQKATVVSSSPRALGPGLSRNEGTFFKYTREERMEALERFREKKRRRQFHKRVRYMVRKRLAETRPRYKGRFSKPPPGENYDDGTPGPPAEKPVAKAAEKAAEKSKEMSAAIDQKSSGPKQSSRAGNAVSKE